MHDEPSGVLRAGLASAGGTGRGDRRGSCGLDARSLAPYGLPLPCCDHADRRGLYGAADSAPAACKALDVTSTHRRRMTVGDAWYPYTRVCPLGAVDWCRATKSSSSDRRQEGAGPWRAGKFSTTSLLSMSWMHMGHATPTSDQTALRPDRGSTFLSGKAPTNDRSRPRPQSF